MNNEVNDLINLLVFFFHVRLDFFNIFFEGDDLLSFAG